MKRIADVSASGVGLCLTAPAMAAIAVAVRVDSPGPVIYRGVRAGKDGRPFQIMKFRTMRQDAEQTGGTTTAMGDPRITKVGGVLRRYKLDELPQLWNVLRGEMSLVGPRPEVFEYVDAYTAEERAILDVKPGITDLASIEFHNLAAHVGSEDADETFRTEVLHRKNALRLEYAKRQSLVLDAKILLRTGWVLARSSLGGER